MKRALLFTCMLAFIACSKQTIEPEETTEPGVSIRSARWESKRITNYTMKQSVSCECLHDGQKMTITVQNNQITDVKNEQGQGLPSLKNQYKTIDQLFDIIRTTDPASVAELRVKYDEKLGYPKYIYIDRNAVMADDEIGYSTEEVVY